MAGPRRKVGPTSWFFNVLAGDRIIGRQPNVGNRKYYHTDLLGSMRAVVEGAAIVESYDPEPWGLLMPGRTLGSGTKEGFTGKERDAESGLDYFGARLYMPAFARWTSVDPLAGEQPEWSPYNYALNSPAAFIDQDGRIPLVVLAVWALRAAPVVIRAGQLAVQLLDPNPNDPGSATISAGKTLAKRAVQNGDKIQDAAATTREIVRSGGKIGDDAGPDFVVAKDGTAVPVSQSKMREGFEAAGFPSRPASKTDEGGVIHEVPTRHGATDVRTMEGKGRHERRAVTTRAGTNDPVRLSGERFQGNVQKRERRDASHLKQKP